MKVSLVFQLNVVDNVRISLPIDEFGKKKKKKHLLDYYLLGVGNCAARK